MRFSGKLALKVGAVGVAAGAILVPMTAAHAVTPAITVTPSTALTDGASVTVAGTGYTAGATIAVLECSANPPASSGQCDLSAIATNTVTASGTGTFSKTITVHTGAIGTGTCAAGSSTCAIVGGNEANQAESAAAGITFAGGAPAGPTVTVTPATGVKDGDSVTVAGSGFPASTAVSALECGAGATTLADCDVSTVKGGMTDATGAFTGVAVTVHTGTVGDKTCAAGGDCAIVASTATTPAGQTATNTGIGTFKFASTTPPPGAAITISPTTNVKSGSNITVSGTGFAAKMPLYAVECSGTTGQAACDTSALGTGQTDASGAFTGVKVPVHSGAVGNGTCNAGQTCYIAATTDPTGTDATQSATATFSFGKGGGTSKPAATKTKAKFSSHKQTISGVVTSKGTGVKGLKTKLEIKKGSHWKAVDSGKTKAGGAFVFKHVTTSGTYEVKTSKNAKFKGSTSKKIKV